MHHFPPRGMCAQEPYIYSSTFKLNSEPHMMKHIHHTTRPISSFIQTPNSPLLFPPKSNNHHPIPLRTSTSLASTLQYIIDSPSPSHGRTIHAQILAAGFRPNTNISIKLLILHLKSGSLANARHLFDRMPNPTLSAYNYLIAAYFKRGLAEAALDLVRNLAFSGETPDGFTLSMVSKLSATLPSLNLARQVHLKIVRLWCGETDDVLVAALIDSYVKNGKLRYARVIYDVMPEKNLVCSTALIVGYMSSGSFNDAEKIFRSMGEKDTVVFNAMIEGYSKTLETAERSLVIYRDMQKLGFGLTVSTFVSVIGACSLCSALEFGLQVHAQTIKTGGFIHVKSASALIDMYSKCGRVDDARGIFDWMPEKNVISWTSMIDGYGKNGMALEALKLFDEMKKKHDAKPNYATFLSALSACGHAGLLSSGQEVFESMEKDYALKPRMEHYACMVDLLGRMGSLLEAYNFIKQIPEKPNSDVWAALLAASRLHGDIEMADVSARELFELNRHDRPGAYVALSNTFAEVGKWEGVCEVREMMKDRGVSKNTGWSWVGTDEA